MTSFIFVRHGKSQANQDDELAFPDSPLTKEGQAQAKKTARELKSRGITTIVASPYNRAQQTAEIIAKELKIADIITLDDLRERGMGNFRGRKREHPELFYYTVEGENDVEPCGVLIARCEAALAQIKKLAETGTVLVVGHAMSGYYLQQVAAGRRFVQQFTEPKELGNAKSATITILDPPRTNISRQAAIAITAIILGLAALALGVFLLVRQPAATTPQGTKQQTIPLSADDYKDDPNLQGAVQKLQQQAQNAQSSGTASSVLQPVTSGIPEHLGN
jgi:broad specificity phosphatase PhoE